MQERPKQTKTEVPPAWNNNALKGAPLQPLPVVGHFRVVGLDDNLHLPKSFNRFDDTAKRERVSPEVVAVLVSATAHDIDAFLDSRH